MPFRTRRNVTRRRPIRKRFVRKRRMPTRRIPRLSNSRRIFFYKQTYLYEDLNVTTTGAIGYGVYAQASILPQWSTFASLYDEYRIFGMKVQFTPSIATSFPGTNINLHYSVIDYDDVGSPPNASALRQYQTLKIRRGTKAFSRYIKPRFTAAALPSVSGTTVTPRSTLGWLNTTNGGETVQHYGLKGWIENMGLTPLPNDYTIRIEIKLYIGFRNVT